MAGTLLRFNGTVSHTFPKSKTTLSASYEATPNRAKTIGCMRKKSDETEEQQSLQSTRRRASLGLVSTVLTMTSGIQLSLAEDNGFWITTEIPIPTIENTELANKETGTRSFLKRGIYMADIGPKMSAYRIRKYAFDLLALSDLLDKDAWNYVSRYLRLKSTFMYYDFDKVISAASADDKKPLIELANRLFDSVEKLEVSVKQHDLSLVESDYKNTSDILGEVMEMMA